jgi:hypothetical protein
MSVWQKCPVCLGVGKDKDGHICRICKGHGIISNLEGKPPRTEEVDKNESHKIRLND